MDPSASAVDIRQAIVEGRTSAEAVCQASLATVADQNDSLNAFILVDAARALERAKAVDAIGTSDAGPLHGVPIALKDNLCTRGMRTTAASRILEGFVPPYNATVVDRLERAGAVVIGKTNCDEFAMGSSTEYSAFGPTRNPWATDRIAGGSSGGSAAAVASRMVPVALGSDTGGSVRQPAALCGVVGLKPTYGRVSRYGLIAFASSLDQIGPFARTVRDAAALLRVIAGSDPRDATSSAQSVPDYADGLTGDIRGSRIGVPRRLLDVGVDPGVSQRFLETLDRFEALGASIVDIDLPHADAAIPVYYLIATAEASSNLARYDGVRYGHRAALGSDEPTLERMYRRTRDEGFGPEVKRRIVLGTYVLSSGYYDAYYLKAQQVRTLIRQDYERAFETVDAVAVPTSPVPAFPLGERTQDPLQMYLADSFTVGASLAGLPAISLPCGATTERLPVGIQLTGRLFDEATLFRLGDAYERHVGGWTEAPPAAPPPPTTGP